MGTHLDAASTPRTRRAPTRRLRAAILTVTVALTLGACGTSPISDDTADDSAGPDVADDDVISQAEALSGQERIDFLIDEASTEDGPLRLYTSLSVSALTPITKAFEAAYGIEVEAYRAGSSDILHRVLQESAADFDRGADVVENRGLELYQLAEEGLIRSVEGDYLDDIPEYGRFDDWTADRLNIIVPCWNTDAVPEGEQPTTYEELADPEWRGRLTVDLADDNWFQTLFQYLVEQGSSEAEVEAYFRAVAASTSVVRGHTAMQEFIVAGQYDVGIDCYTYVTDGQKADGAPTDWQPAVEPAISQPNGVGVMRNAKDPASAALFYQWLLTDGQQVLADAGITPVTATVEAEVIPLDIEGFASNAAEWSARYEEIFQDDAS